jgi:hypothetical protein
VKCDDERRPGPRHDVDAFGFDNGDTLGLWDGDPLGGSGELGELGNSSSMGDDDGFGSSGYNRLLSDVGKPPRSWSVLSLCIRSCKATATS